MKLNRKSGAALAAAAAFLVISATAPVTPAAAAYKVKCFGVNACKGQGYVLMGKAACLAKGGTLTHS